MTTLQAVGKSSEKSRHAARKRTRRLRRTRPNRQRFRNLLMEPLEDRLLLSVAPALSEDNLFPAPLLASSDGLAEGGGGVQNVRGCR